MSSFMNDTLYPLIDDAITCVVSGMVADKDRSDDAVRYRIGEAQRNLLHLSKGLDAFYDCPEIGWLYLSWYHPRRSLQMMNGLRSVWDACKGTHLEVLDLGCGTGATLWGLSFLALQADKDGTNELEGPSTITYRGIDASAIMLRAAETSWDSWAGSLPKSPNRFTEIQWTHNRWETEQASATCSGSHKLLTAGYLFDSTDDTRIKRLSDNFAEYAEAFAPKWVYVTTSKKKDALVSAALKGLGTGLHTTPPLTLPAQSLPKLTERRAQLQSEFNVPLPGTVKSQSNETTVSRLWEIPFPNSQSGRINSRQSVFRIRKRSPTSKDWTSDQKDALHLDLPLKVMGAAGSGKTQILIERIVKLIKDRRERLVNDDPLNILVVNRNNGMNCQTAQWFYNRVEKRQWVKPTKKGMSDNWKTYQPFDESKYDFNLTFSSFDKLVHDSLGAKLPQIQSRDGQVITDSDWKFIQNEDVYNELPPRLRKRPFLESEFHRVYHGQGFHKHEGGYEGQRRRGRPTNPRVERKDRDPLFRCLQRIDQYKTENCDKADTWTHRRLRATRNGRGSFEKHFTHLFVDECQDLLEEEFRWLYGMVKEPNNIFICIDTAQSVHVGASTHAPHPEGTSFGSTKLQTSLRMPYRIAQFVTPAQRHIHSQQAGAEANDDLENARLEASKEAIPGVRPVVIYAKQPQCARRQLEAVWDEFGRQDDEKEIWCFDVNQKELNEQYPDLADSSIRFPAKKIVKDKGLESSYVLWLTDIPTVGVHDDERHEAGYTIMTRATYLLVILISPETTPEHWALLGNCNSDVVQFWTPEAKDFFHANTRQSP